MLSSPTLFGLKTNGSPSIAFALIAKELETTDSATAGSATAGSATASSATAITPSSARLDESRKRELESQVTAAAKPHLMDWTTQETNAFDHRVGSPMEGIASSICNSESSQESPSESCLRSPLSRETKKLKAVQRHELTEESAARNFFLASENLPAVPLPVKSSGLTPLMNRTWVASAAASSDSAIEQFQLHAPRTSPPSPTASYSLSRRPLPTIPRQGVRSRFPSPYEPPADRFARRLFDSKPVGTLPFEDRLVEDRLVEDRLVENRSGVNLMDWASKQLDGCQASSSNPFEALPTLYSAPMEVRSMPSVAEGSLSPLPTSKTEEDQADASQLSLSPSFQKLPPRGPEKPARKRSTPFLQIVEAIYSSGRINYRGGEFSIEKVHGACGEHSQVFFLTDSKPLLPPLDNSAILIKLFLLKEVVSKLEPERQWLPSILRQYEHLRSISFPTVEIYNASTAAADGYFIVERIQPLQSQHLTRSDVRTQLIDLFLKANRNPHSIPVDFQLSNFGLRGDQVVLLDFMEHDDEVDYAFILSRAKYLRSITQIDAALAQEIQTALDSDKEAPSQIPLLTVSRRPGKPIFKFGKDAFTSLS